MQITGMLFHIDVPGELNLYKPCRKCATCGEEINDDEDMFEIEQGFWVCDACLLDEVVLNVEPAALAKALGFEKKKAGDI